jgi:quinol monooxygenase YgiN
LFFVLSEVSMLARLVRMRFQPDKVDEFLALYATAQPIIATQPGCHSVQLVRQIDDPSAFATWSLWQDASALEAYRTSAFFLGFWPQVRALFRQPADATSFEVIA